MSNRESGSAEDSTRTAQIKRWLAKWTRPAEFEEPSEPIGGNQPIEELHLPDEWVGEIDVVYDGERYEFVVENGELGLERVEDDG